MTSAFGLSNSCDMVMPCICDNLEAAIVLKGVANGGNRDVERIVNVCYYVSLSRCMHGTMFRMLQLCCDGPFDVRKCRTTC